MSYNEFEQLLLHEMKEDAADSMDVRICEIRKNNGVRRRAIVLRDNTDCPQPMQYLEDYYDMWETGVSIHHIVNLILQEREKMSGVYRKLPSGFFQNYEEVRKNLRCHLISEKKNRELLREVPHLRWMDLAITCVYDLSEPDYPDCMIQIRNDHLQIWGVSADQIMKDAMAATAEHSEILFQPLVRILEEDLRGSESEVPDTPLYLLTNQSRMYGAVCIALPDVKEHIAQRLDSDYFIIPSSIHECLILPDDGIYRTSELNRMVCDINQTNVEDQDVLSDHVYLYKQPEARMYRA